MSDLFLLMLLALLGLGLVACGFMLLRNQFVYRTRIHFIDNRPFPQEYKALPEYEEMLNRPKYWLLWTPRHWEAWVQRRMS